MQYRGDEAGFPTDLFAGQRVFVTGGGSGINLGIAEGFAKHGAAVAICGRSPERLEQAKKTLERFGGEVLALQADVRDPTQLEAAFEASGSALGDMDVLVCAAAGNFVAGAGKISPNGFRTVLEIDLFGAFHAASAGFEQLRRRKGSVLFVSAPQAFLAHANQAHVGAAKAGIEMLMRSLALEWGPDGIRCNSIIPGLIAGTEGLNRLFGDVPEAELTAHIPLRRMGGVEDIANAALFLASPMASYISGTSLFVDGAQIHAGTDLFNRVTGRLVAQSNRS